MPIRYVRQRPRLFFIAILAIALVAWIFVDIEIRDGYHGLFVLKTEKGAGIELVNDIYPDEIDRLLISFDFDPFRKWIVTKKNRGTVDVFLEYVWDSKRSRGFVTNYLGGNSELLICISRFKDKIGYLTNGLFMGGELPATSVGTEKNLGNDTGMAYFDGNRWYHIWCTINQGITSGKTMNNFPPNMWRFLGSSIPNKTPGQLVLKSTHSLVLDEVPLLIERYVLFQAGEPYYVMVQNVRNTGTVPVSYYFIYGDEPWLGQYGTSKGNIGWVENRLILREEEIDSRKYSFAGFFDYGNELINEGHNFTRVANFIEWIGPNKPEYVYFVNQENGISLPVRPKLPLYSKDSRFIGLQWGPHIIEQQKSDIICIAVGMALPHPQTGMPVKPAVKFDLEDFVRQYLQ